MDTSYLSLLSRNCPKRVVVFFFRRGLPHMFRNNLNCISASLTVTALLLALLHCKDTYHMHCCCLLHFTETNKL